MSLEEATRSLIESYYSDVEAMLTQYTTRERIISGDDKLLLVVLSGFEIPGVMAAHLLVNIEDPASPKAVDMRWLKAPGRAGGKDGVPRRLTEWVGVACRSVRDVVKAGGAA